MEWGRDRGEKGGESICEEIPEGDRLERTDENKWTDGDITLVVDWMRGGAETIKKEKGKSGMPAKLTGEKRTVK